MRIFSGINAKLIIAAAFAAAVLAGGSALAVEKPITLSHRGANLEADENTLTAYKLSIGYRMDFIECDPRITKDGELIIMHDPEVSRTTNGKGKVADLTLAEIKVLRTKKHNDTVPKFDEVLSLAKDNNVRVFIDTKLYTDDYMAIVTKHVVDAGMADRVTIGCWTIEQLRWMKKNHPEMTTNIPYPAPVSSMKQAKKLGASWIGAVIEQTNADLFAKAAAEGLKVVTMPLDTRELIVQKINEGMQVIQTNNPKLLRQIIDEMFGK